MTSRYIQKQHCEATQLENESIILDTQFFTVTQINEMGSFCWSLLDSPKSVEHLVTAIQETYQTADSPENIQVDVEQFINEMLRYGLVEHVR